MAGNYEKMLDYYPLLIESAIDFKIESRKILAQHNSKYFNSHFYWPLYRMSLKCSMFVWNYIDAEPQISSDVETCIVAPGYRIVKHND